MHTGDERAGAIGSGSCPSPPSKAGASLAEAGRFRALPPGDSQNQRLGEGMISPEAFVRLATPRLVDLDVEGLPRGGRGSGGVLSFTIGVWAMPSPSFPTRGMLLA